MELESPRMETAAALIVAGLSASYTRETMREIPLLWQSLIRQRRRIPGKRGGRVAYGVCRDMLSGKSAFGYLAGVEVSDAAAVPPEFAAITIPAQRYAVFAHRGPAWKLSATVNAIYGEWFPQSGYRQAHSAGMPDFFERYGEAFDPIAAQGDLEVWMPIE